jgi:hypothetical protein
LKDKSLGVISQCDFKEKSLLLFDKRWKDFFIGDPIFEVIIKDERIILRGPKVSPRRIAPTVAQEDTAYE